MAPDRRDVLTMGAFALAGAAVTACQPSADRIAGGPAHDDAGWTYARSLFPRSGDIQMSGLLLTSHPRPVAEAIAAVRALR
jgi:hypothetical protein